MKKIILIIIIIPILLFSWFGAYIMNGNYGKTSQPTASELKNNIVEISDSLGASAVSPMVFLIKGNYASLSTSIKYEKLNEISISNFPQILKKTGWVYVESGPGSFVRYCRNEIVLEFELPTTRQPLTDIYPLEVAWGESHIRCKR